MSVFLLHDAFGMVLAFLLALWFWVFDQSCSFLFSHFCTAVRTIVLCEINNLSASTTTI
jgi:hypothetical protein